MIGTNWKYKEQSIENSTPEYEIMLSDTLTPRGLEVRDTSQNIPRYHGVLTSATFASERVIPIEGFIAADTRLGFGKAITYLDRLFSLQGNPGTLKLETFEFTDEENNTWLAGAKIKRPIEYILYDDDSYHFIRKFRVVLMAPDPNFYSKDIIKQIGGLTGFNNAISMPNDGVAIPSEGIAFNEGSSKNIIGADLVTELGGNQTFEPKIVITILKDTQEYLKIINNTTGSYMRFEIEALAGDIIIIDNQKEEATKNGSNIIQYKSLGDFFEVASGHELDIYDVTNTYFGEVVSFEVFFKSILQ